MRTVLSLAFAAALAFTASPCFAQGSAGSMVMPTCPATDPVVWLNTNSKVFHAQGDKYFGHTKSGKFLCQSQAVAAGGRAAKHGMTKGTKGSMSTGAPSMNSATSTPSKRTKKHRGAMGTTAPAAGPPAPSPQATRLP